MSTSNNILFVSHGGGPLPLLGDAGHQEMVQCLEKLAGTLPRPDAILVISAHWEAAVPTITAAPHPPLFYDYYGFPPEAYQIQYPCPGAPVLAEQLQRCLENAGMKAQLDAQRGFDHGVFVPLALMYPQADIPCVQLSLVNNLDAGTHLAMGEALRGLETDNLLVLGSGFTFHNMRAFFADDPQIDERNRDFQAWLAETCSSLDMEEQARRARLLHWEQAPQASFCHPRAEHLLPLHVCYGLAGRAADNWIPARIFGKDAGMVLWQA